jgi:hypothetical protein
MANLQHMYFDTSNLNAQYDYTPPLQGLGAGSLSTGSLGSLGAITGDDSVDFPWREESDETRNLQSQVNVTLSDAGYCRIAEDGVLGPATCGATRFVIEELEMTGWSPPSTCQSFTDPRRPPCGGTAPAPVTTPPDLTRSRAPSGGTNWLLIGGVVAAVAIGGALMLKKKRGR